MSTSPTPGVVTGRSTGSPDIPALPVLPALSRLPTTPAHPPEKPAPSRRIGNLQGPPAHQPTRAVAVPNTRGGTSGHCLPINTTVAIAADTPGETPCPHPRANGRHCAFGRVHCGGSQTSCRRGTLRAMPRKRSAGAEVVARIVAEMKTVGLEPDGRELELLRLAADLEDRRVALEAAIARGGLSHKTLDGPVLINPMVAESRQTPLALSRTLSGV
jgi:hypothetical protein